MSASRQLSKGKFGPSGKPLAALSEQELRDELRRRRKARAGEAEAVDPQPSWKRVRQYFANLELEPGAGLEEVERAYKRLFERYHPDKHRGDSEKFVAAKELSDSLTDAYNALRRHLRK